MNFPERHDWPKRIRVGSTFLMLICGQVVAQPVSDWIDELPSVTVIAQVAFEENKVTASGAPQNGYADPDEVAVNLAATLLMLRQAIWLKAWDQPWWVMMWLAPEDDPWWMASGRKDRLRAVVAAYREAELALAHGAVMRNGYIKRAEPDGRGCGADAKSATVAGSLALNAASSRASGHRAGVEPPFSMQLAGSGARRPSASGRQLFVHAGLPVTGDDARDRQRARGLAPIGCETYGGDADMNGLCDDWPPAVVAVDTTSEVGADTCTPMQLTSVRREEPPSRTSSIAGLKVSIAAGTARPGTVVGFRVRRAASPAGALIAAVWEGTAAIESKNPLDAQGALFATIARGAPLDPDPNRPFLVVDVPSVAVTKPVHCEQPLESWLKRQLGNFPAGLHGPYDDLQAAVLQPGSIVALQMTQDPDFFGWSYQGEHGFLIVQDRRALSGGYFVTPPVPSSQSGLGRQVDGPKFPFEDYYESFKTGFQDSCADEEHFAVAASVHTHPGAFGRGNQFSRLDFEGSLASFFLPGADNAVWGAPDNVLYTAMEAAVMLSEGDLCVRTYVPEPGDTIPVTDALYEAFNRRVAHPQTRIGSEGTVCPAFFTRR